MSAEALCGRRFSMWDGEWDGQCELPAGHDGLHVVEDFEFDDNGQFVMYEWPSGRPFVGDFHEAPYVESKA